MPIIGVIDSSKSGNLYAASFDSIATVTVGSGGSSVIEFANIPATYTHLQLRGIARSTAGGDMPKFRINNSSNGGDYVWHNLAGDGANASAGNSGGQGDTFIRFRNISQSSSISNAFGTFIIDILDYASTNKNKVVKMLAGNDNNGSGGFVALTSGAYLPTTAITNIRFVDVTYGQYSQFALYGIKVA